MWAGRVTLSVSKSSGNNNNNYSYGSGRIVEKGNSKMEFNLSRGRGSSNSSGSGRRAFYYSPISSPSSPSSSSLLLSPQVSPSLFHFSTPSLSMAMRGRRRMSSKRDDREELEIKVEEDVKEKKNEGKEDGKEKNREGAETEEIEVIEDVEELPPTPPNTPTHLYSDDDLSSSPLLEGEAIERNQIDQMDEDDDEDVGDVVDVDQIIRDEVNDNDNDNLPSEGLVESEGGNGGGEGGGMTRGGSGGGKGGRKKGRGAQIISSSFYAPVAGFKVPSKVPIFPFSRRPIFPGVLTPLVIHDKTLAQKLLARKEKGFHFIGVFLSKVPFDPVPPSSDNPSSSSSSSVVTPTYQVIEDPSLVHSFGVLARVERIIFTNPASGGATVMLTGVMRIKLGGGSGSGSGGGGGGEEGKGSSGNVTDHLPPDPSLPHYLHEIPVTRVADKAYDRGDSTLRAYTAEVVSTIKEIVKLNPFFKEQLQTVLDYIDLSNPGELADLSACLTTSDSLALQEVLEESDVILRLSKSLALLKKELEISQLQMKIHKQLESQMHLNQRKYFLNEQLKAIKKELGIETDEKETLVNKFTKRLEALKISDVVQKAIDDEITKLSSLDPSSSEFNVTRSYLDWITSLPWGITNPDSLDVPHAQRILDEDHYGLKDIKERILEFIAVGKMKGTLSGKILCFVGPPGVGKTSIGKSISRALGREFFRFSVGGMQDVAEIKGHRRTYVGAMPGKIIQSLKRVGTSNPVILLDEVDKIGKGGYQGDPSSALLEVLDPSQNKDFLDHYLDLPFDLSKVLFICTANVTDSIPGPLLDRMEVLRLSGYVNQEKFAIAKQYLIPTAREETGVTSSEQGVITESALNDLVQHYCRESGVRNLQKHIEKVFRKMAFKITQGEKGRLVVNGKNISEFVGKRVFPKEKMYEITPPGVVTGLAWTSMGGATLYIESAISPSSSSQDSAGLYTTGQMGDVMKESTKISYSFAKHFLLTLSHLPSFHPYIKFFDSKWLHMHIPEGATPKDGPSAGITMVTSLISLAINQPVRQDLAMTGELSLTGLVLPIGGVKEKVLAAKRSNVKYIIFPKANLFDWEDLDQYLKDDLTSFFVEHYRDVFTIAFGTEEEMHAMIPRNKSTPDLPLPSVDLEL